MAQLLGQPVMRDNAFSPEDTGEDGMSSDNGRIQRLEQDGSRLEGRVDSIDDSVRKIQAAVGRIDGYVADQKATPAFWTKFNGIAALLAGIAALCGFGYTVYQENSPNSVRGKLASIEGQIHGIQGQVTRLQSDLRVLTTAAAPQLLSQMGQIMTSAVSLPVGQVGPSMIRPLETLDMLNANRVKAKADDLAPAMDATRKLIRADADVPEVWQAAFSLVSYRFAIQADFSKEEMPDCLSKGENAIRRLRNTPDWYLLGSGNPIRLAGSHCVLDLGDVDSFNKGDFRRFFEEAKKRNPGNPRILALSHARIVYSGGNIIPIDQITCDDCTFELRAPHQAPPPAGRSLTDQLLMADLDTGKVHLSLGS
jgi:hypothetical protein